ncbi:hypothetical protein [Ensifer sp.]|uniref:hypothetical protein n=1 Tax=Ensifer sp. TaxID=1872086 RepID=UPI00289F3BA8|nr:hypothetical protein [Ensifer sp.]
MLFFTLKPMGMCFFLLQFWSGFVPRGGEEAIYLVVFMGFQARATPPLRGTL